MAACSLRIILPIEFLLRLIAQSEQISFCELFTVFQKKY